MEESPKPKRRNVPQKYSIINEEQEEWRDIPDLSPFQASNLGRIRNTKTSNILAGGISNGYRMVSISINGKTKTYYAHILVATCFLGERPVTPDGQKYEINHKDLNRANAAVENLEYITKSQNITHSYDMNPYWSRNLVREIDPKMREKLLKNYIETRRNRRNG